jgi:hypothetical protein
MRVPRRRPTQSAGQRQQPAPACLGGTGSPPPYLLIGAAAVGCGFDAAAAAANTAGAAGHAVSNINMLVISQGRWNRVVSLILRKEDLHFDRKRPVPTIPPLPSTCPIPEVLSGLH